MTLAELVAKSGASFTSTRGAAEVLRPCANTREVVPGDLFFCMPSARTDTHALIAEAAGLGAVAAVLHGPEGVAQSSLPYLLPAGGSNGFQEACWRLAHTLLQHPSHTLKTIGVTGTNGKTTTAWLLRDLLTAQGERAAYLGTLGYHDAVGVIDFPNTTPMAVELANLLAVAKTRGCTALALEVSSHALAERRADGVEFDAAVFTNLTQDHLDFHHTMDAYAEAKWRLFSDLPAQSDKRFVAALNLDDPVGRVWASRADCPVIPYSIHEGDERTLQGHAEAIELGQITLSFRFLGHEYGPVTAPLGGSYNVFNLVSAVAGMVAVGYPLEAVVPTLSTVHPVPGRFESVRNDKGLGVIVDYAHTPDALEKLLDAVRPLSTGRIITVFGCGGDRDPNKRPKMARSASDRSDLTIVTSDNPRTEDPEAILSEVAAGVRPGGDSLQIVDRREAVAEAIRLANPGDVVVIAGKGHEDYQIIGHTKFPMDDRELAKAALAGRP